MVPLLSVDKPEPSLYHAGGIQNIINARLCQERRIMAQISEYGLELCRMFDINSEELLEHSKHGVERALFHRWIQGEWVGV